eukprot:s2303_g9.t1
MTAMDTSEQRIRLQRMDNHGQLFRTSPSNKVHGVHLCTRAGHDLSATWTVLMLIVAVVSLLCLARQGNRATLSISGRAVCGLIQSRLRPYVKAFLSFGSCAIVWMDKHPLKYGVCRRRRFSINATSDTQLSRSEKKRTRGSIQVSLDLSQAFDRLEWTLIREALTQAAVPSELYDLIVMWHRALCYHLRVCDATAKVDIRRGVRQGCRIAPMLWALSTAVILRRTDQALDLGCSLAAFADDVRMREHLRKVTDLDGSLWRVGCFLDQLLDSHLLVNAKKSAALLRLTKGFAPSWVKSHIRKGPDGPFLHFCTPAGRSFDIPLKTEHVYLGLTISYHNAVSLSVTHRIDAAWSSWAKLRPMLTSASAPALDLRLRLWRACIPPTLLYGLHILPLTVKHLNRLQAVYTRHLRAVSKSQAHLTFESTAALHGRLGVPTVKDILMNGLEGLRLRVGIAVDAGLESADMPQYCRNPSHSLLALSDPCHISSAFGDPCSSSLPSGLASADTASTQVQCPDCSAVFPDLRMIRVHQASHHKVTVEQRNLGVSFDPLQHARAGMPICALCDKVFSRWSVLRDHIQKGRCAFLDTTLVPCDSALYSIA